MADGSVPERLAWVSVDGRGAVFEVRARGKLKIGSRRFPRCTSAATIASVATTAMYVLGRQAAGLSATGVLASPALAQRAKCPRRNSPQRHLKSPDTARGNWLM